MTTGKAILNEEQRALLAAALNRIVPAEGEMPGAGDLGIGGFVEEVASGDASKRRLLLDGLRQIELEAANRAGVFRACPARPRRQCCRRWTGRVRIFSRSW